MPEDRIPLPTSRCFLQCTSIIFAFRDLGIFLGYLSNHPSKGYPALPADQLFLKQQPIAWDAWVAAWERDQAGLGKPSSVLPQVCVLPPTSRDLLENLVTSRE